MSGRVARVLRSLRDIDGVLGSFLIGERGAVLGADVPAACGSELLHAMANRLQQLCDAFVTAEIGGPVEATTLHFAQYKLHVRALGSASLVAVVAVHTNLPALKMAMSLLGRQLLAELGDASSAGRSSAVYESLLRAPQPLASPARSYRGRPVG